MSKTAGGEWILGQGQVPIVTSAMAVRDVGADVPLDRDAVLTFLAGAIRAVERLILARRSESDG